jgi:quinol monooxygenase YgiN
VEEGKDLKDSLIHVRAEFNIEDGKIEGYKKLVQDMSRAVEANEPETTRYQFYLDGPETKCIVWETYTSSEAALAHINGAASQIILPKIFNISKMTKIEVYGKPSEELRKAIIGSSPQTYNLFAGFSRCI